jgi:MFS family permease
VTTSDLSTGQPEDVSAPDAQGAQTVPIQGAASPTPGDVPGNQPKVKVKDRLGSAYWRLWTSTVSSNLGDGIGFIAYPWLASAITRSPMLLAIIGLTATLPWLLFSLPAGVIIDRVDRKKLVVGMDVLRGLITLISVIGVIAWSDALLSPEELKGGAEVQTHWPLYLLLVTASFLLGLAQVLRDNAGTSLLPSIVRKDQLEKANGRMWAAEMVTGNLIGPPIGSFLLGIAFFLPILVDGLSFFVAAGLVFLIPGFFHPKKPDANGVIAERRVWHVELKEALRWLRGHSLLWPMALILACINLFSSLGAGTMILYAQEVLRTSPLQFALMMTGGAVGGVVGSLMASRISRRFGAGAVIQTLLFSMPIQWLIIGFAPSWIIVWLSMIIGMMIAMTWNTITVSLRQSIIPDELLGRVNSAYRFLVLGAMPIGTTIGGALVTILARYDREWALRSPWILAGALGIVLAFAGHKYLAQDRIDDAKRAAGIEV